jgi:glutamine amidotransferase
MAIAIVDYGMGNIKSLVSAFKYLGESDIIVTSSYEELKGASKLILPGVGAYADAMSKIQDSGIDEFLGELILHDQKPVLGICLGMQLLAESSTEGKFTHGLSFIKGALTRLPPDTIKVPHVGFDQVSTNSCLRLYSGFNQKYVDFYFTHSYCMQSDDRINQCYCSYGETFIASFEKGNIAGVQFHPELSQRNGLKLLKNYIEKF